MEVATAATATAAAAPAGTPFLVEAYGYRTGFGQVALDADDALLRAWAVSVPPEAGDGEAASYRCKATRHVLGLQITLPHPLLAPGFVKGPLTVLLSVR